MTDWDNTLAYSTIKMVRVRDKRLGILHYAFSFIIFSYIVVYIQLVEKQFRRTEAPEGTVRVNLQFPGPCPAGTGGACQGYQQERAELPYCNTYAGPPVPGLLMPSTLQCRYPDQNFAAWPAVEQRGIFAATRITETVQELAADCTPDPADGDNPLPSPSCYSWANTSAETYYVSQIEEFTAFIEHTMTASSLGISKTWGDTDLIAEGIFDPEGTRIEACDDYPSGSCPPVVQTAMQTGQRNILPLRTLLRAAGITDLDTGGDVSCEADSVRPSPFSRMPARLFCHGVR